MATARYYDEEKAGGQFFPGVPARDLEDEEYDALPKWLQKSIDDSPMYRKSKVGTEAPATPKKKSGKKKRAAVAKSPAEEEAEGIEKLTATLKANLTPAPEGEEE